MIAVVNDFQSLIMYRSISFSGIIVDVVLLVLLVVSVWEAIVSFMTTAILIAKLFKHTFGIRILARPLLNICFRGILCKYGNVVELALVLYTPKGIVMFFFKRIYQLVSVFVVKAPTLVSFYTC